MEHTTLTPFRTFAFHNRMYRLLSMFKNCYFVTVFFTSTHLTILLCHLIILFQNKLCQAFTFAPGRP